MDELTNEFASLPHDKARKRNIVQKHVEAVRIGDEISAALTGVPLNKVIARFLRAFHTALYDAYLPNKTDNAILPRFPPGTANRTVLSLTRFSHNSMTLP
jgi:hypothetical protein